MLRPLQYSAAPICVGAEPANPGKTCEARQEPLRKSSQGLQGFRVLTAIRGIREISTLHLPSKTPQKHPIETTRHLVEVEWGAGNDV